VNAALVDRALRDRRLQSLSEAIRAYEATHGEITTDEMTPRLAATESRLRSYEVLAALRSRQANELDEGRHDLVFDAGGLMSLERDERASWVRLKSACLRGEVP